MRIIHTRKRVFKTDFAFQNKMTLLVWVLSILKWKHFGNKMILYCDSTTLASIKKFKFDHLYDEINTTLLDQPYNHLDFYNYWAMPKLLALRHETVALNNKCVIVDQDVVPMTDLKRFWNTADVVAWSNKEFLESKYTYPEVYELSLPKNYTLPKWFTGTARPLNTGLLYFRNNAIADLYTREVLNLALDNPNDKKNTNCQTMCNAEQRLLGEVIQYKNLTYNVIQPVNEGLFNKNAFHTHGYKSVITNVNGFNWHLNLLKMIKDLDIDMFYSILDNELFKEEREHLLEYKPIEPVKELQIYNK